MITRRQWRRFIDHPVTEWAILAVGVLLMLAAIPVGALPGPGGIFVFAAGLALVLKTSMWAKRRYVRFKKWKPKAGRWTDWGLRRTSARRREALRRERKERKALEASLQSPGDAPANAPMDRQGD
jgi:hypothetical protein